MTTFEITITILALLVVLLISFIAYRVNYFLKDLQTSKYRDHQLLKNIDVNTATPIDIFRRIEKQLCNNESTVDQDLLAIDDKLDKMLTIYYMQHTTKFNEMMVERMKQGLKDIRMYPPEFMRPPFDPTCETTNKED